MTTWWKISPELRGFYIGDIEKNDVKNKLIAVSDGVKSVTTFGGIMWWQQSYSH